jgi:glutamate carboxypeptidase
MAPAGLPDLSASVGSALPDLLRDLERLVAIDSGTYTKPGVDEVGAWMAERLLALGASVERQADTQLGDTFVATFAREGGGPSVLLIGHTDTVFEPGTAAARPFSTRGGHVLGPGVADMKAGLLAGLHALTALRSVAAARLADPGAVSIGDWLPVGRLHFIVNSDEEIGSPSSTALISRLAAHADAALVLEAARENGDIVSSRKGHTDLRLRIHGRAAHAGVEPHKGRSAVLEAAHKILALHGLNGRYPGVTVNAGVVHGGTRPNIVAESASIEVDVRAVQRRDQEAVEAAIEAIAEASSVPDVVGEVEIASRHWPMERTEVSGWLVEHAMAVAAQLEIALGEAATGGASDGNTTAGLGVPTIDGLGPIGGLDHAPGEYVELASIVPRTVLLAGLLQAIGADPRFDGRSRHG